MGLAKVSLYFSWAFLLALFCAGDVGAQSRGFREEKPVYCWQENGARVCGNTPPPNTELSQIERVSTRTGVVINKKEPSNGAVTPEPKIDVHSDQKASMTKTPFVETVKVDTIKSEILASELALKNLKKQVSIAKKQLLASLEDLADRELEGSSISDKEKNTLLETKKTIILSEKNIDQIQNKLRDLKNPQIETNKTAPPKSDQASP